VHQDEQELRTAVVGERPNEAKASRLLDAPARELCWDGSSGCASGPSRRAASETATGREAPFIVSSPTAFAVMVLPAAHPA
jgi:hypothetical protein